MLNSPSSISLPLELLSILGLRFYGMDTSLDIWNRKHSTTIVHYSVEVAGQILVTIHIYSKEQYLFKIDV